MNGLDLIRKIKIQPTLKNVPVIFFTGNPEPGVLTLAHRLGVFRTFVKPLKFDALLAIIQEALVWGSQATSVYEKQ